MHLAIYFPGGYTHGQDPFFEPSASFTIRVLEQAGAFVLPVRYDDDVLAPDRERFESGICREVRGALAHHQPDRLTVAGKSRGTAALRIVCTENFDLPDDTRLIWLTPTWDSNRSWQAACSTTLSSLHVVGLADHEYHRPERHTAVHGETVAIEGADHGLRVKEDVFASLDAQRTMAEAIYRFAARL